MPKYRVQRRNWDFLARYLAFHGRNSNTGPCTPLGAPHARRETVTAWLPPSGLPRHCPLASTCMSSSGWWALRAIVFPAAPHSLRPSTAAVPRGDPPGLQPSAEHQGVPHSLMLAWALGAESLHDARLRRRWLLPPGSLGNPSMAAVISVDSPVPPRPSLRAGGDAGTTKRESDTQPLTTVERDKRVRRAAASPGSRAPLHGRCDQRG